MKAFELLPIIGVRDNRKGSALIDFIEKFLSDHIHFLNYVHRYVISCKCTL